ncbi:MAG TPA: MFS transporter [Rhodanobacteraceae bacterium]|nr:MFS transporter [Rhodanobacteraceae bacterium]
MSEPVPALRLSAFYFAYYAALGAFTPYWSLFLKARGQDAVAISVLMSLWYATRVLAPSTWGWLAGRSSRPVRWLRIGSVATLAGCAVFLVPLGFTGLALAMCGFCFAWNAVMPQFESITLSHLPGRSERYGRIRVWGSIGFIAVVGLFGIAFDHWPITALPLMMLPLFAGLVAASFGNDYGPGVHEIVVGATGFAQLLRRGEVRAFFAVAFLMQVSYGPYYTFFSLYLEQHGYRPSALGGYWAVGVAAEIVVFFISARLFARWDPRRIVPLALVFAALRWWVTALFPENVPVMIAAQLTHAISFAGFFAASMMLLARYFPGRSNGHAQGIYYGLSSGVGGVLGALLAGWMWQIGGGRLAFLVAGVAALAGAILAMTSLRTPAAQVS